MAGGGQWSFRKTRTLESQAEIGVWVRTAVTALWIRLCRYVDIRRDWDRRSANRYIRARAAEARLRHCGLLVAAAAS